MKKLLYKIYFLIVSYFYIFSSNFVFADTSVKEWIWDFPWAPSIITTNNDSTLSGLAKIVISYTFYLLAFIVITVFLYIWFIFITAQWNEERFKKAWKMFTYAVVWLAVVSISWAAVKLISSLSI